MILGQDPEQIKQNRIIELTASTQSDAMLILMRTTFLEMIVPLLNALSPTQEQATALQETINALGAETEHLIEELENKKEELQSLQD